MTLPERPIEPPDPDRPPPRMRGVAVDVPHAERVAELDERRDFKRLYKLRTGRDWRDRE